ncbi:MAG TPA: hypothetical protein HA282_03865 [Nanoarchaeota archaeon]|nr:hypothetical protein [Candidatus Pacearchaeota archaeon]HIH34747.1 hypothetical protein [Nanoarchaeota archaeon]HIH51350.1 hypothetical protein [Nanoarchaeota archaeon]HIH66327.1 hypothetical protein [Nanoarchaeota archaeon]
MLMKEKELRDVEKEQKRRILHETRHAVTSQSNIIITHSSTFVKACQDIITATSDPFLSPETTGTLVKNRNFIFANQKVVPALQKLASTISENVQRVHQFHQKTFSMYVSDAYQTLVGMDEIYSNKISGYYNIKHAIESSYPRAISYVLNDLNNDAHFINRLAQEGFLQNHSSLANQCRALNAHVARIKSNAASAISSMNALVGAMSLLKGEIDKTYKNFQTLGVV